MVDLAYNDILQMIADERGYKLETADCQMVPAKLWLNRDTFLFILYLCDQVQILPNGLGVGGYYFSLEEPDSITQIFQIIDMLLASGQCWQPTN